MNRRDLFKLSAAAAIAPVLPVVATEVVAQTPTPLLKKPVGGTMYVFRRWVDATTFSDLLEYDDPSRHSQLHRYNPRPNTWVTCYDSPVVGFRARQIILIQEPKTYMELRAFTESIMLRLMPGGMLIAQYPREWYAEKFFNLDQEVRAGIRGRYTSHEIDERKRVFALSGVKV